MLNQIYVRAVNWADSLSMQQWLLVLIGVLALGAFFLRGFGSRHNY